jgi:hypothetical protein
MFGEQGAEVILWSGDGWRSGQRGGEGSPGNCAADSEAYSFGPAYGGRCGAASAELKGTENCHFPRQAEEIQHCKQAVWHPIEHLQISL